jgi:[ribosomal protein S5]-alanine N-acetyltransferase
MTLPGALIETPRLLLDVPGPEAAPRVREFLLANRERFEPLAPELPPDYYHVGRIAQRLGDARRDHAEGRALRMRVFERERGLDGPVVGTVNITDIVRGPTQLCWLGYAIDGRLEGRGLMAEAVRGAIDHVFRALRLHRVCAGYLPTNQRSAQLLKRLGFVVEGYARDYLRLGEKWHDSVLCALVAPDEGDDA